MERIQRVGFGLPMARVSVARMATAKPQGWVDASLGMGSPGPTLTQKNTAKI